MRHSLASCFLALGMLVAAGARPEPPLPDGPVVLIRLDGQVGSGMRRSLERRLQEAARLDPALIVFELDSRGGSLEHAMAVSRQIFDIRQPLTVAYVNDTAVSAGALLALACDEIVMQRGSSLGAMRVIDYTGEPVLSEKLDSCLRATVRTYCEGKFPIPIADAMVTTHIEVVEARTADGQTHYLTASEFDSLGGPEAPRYVSHKKIDDDRTVVTLTDAEALRYGFSRTTVHSREALLAVYGLEGRRIEELEWTRLEKARRSVDTYWPVLLILGILAAGLVVVTATVLFIVYVSLRLARRRRS